MTKFKGYVIAVLVSVAIFTVAYVVMSIRMDMCPLFTTCIQVR